MANPYTSLMAGPTMSAREQQAIIANPELVGLDRQRKMAELLLAEGLKGQPEGQMVSGYYVAPHWTQRLNPVLNRLMGEQGLKDVDEKTLKLAEQLRKRDESELERFIELQQGRPAQQMEMAGPYGMGMGQDGANIPMPTMAMPAIEPSRAAALRFAAQAQNPALRQVGMKAITEGPIKVGIEDTLIDPLTMQPIRQGQQKPTTDVQNYNFAVSQGYRGSFTDFKNQLTPYQQAQIKLDREKFEFEKSKEGTKPLTETQSNSVAFGARAVEANRIATELENKGVTNIGATRTVVGGVAGTAPLIGERLEQGVRSTFNVLPEFAGGPSPEQQQNEQARRNFVSAVLRKESGAAISPKEYAEEERKYFPQLGDSPAVIKQKQEARRLAIKALEAQAGPQGSKQINQIANAQLTPQDQEALVWANANPNDPRSAQIKQRLGR